MFEHAIVRRPGPNFGDGLTTANLGPPDHHTMVVQHESYVLALERAGLMIMELPAAMHLPDAYFVEDAAVVVPELAVLTRPGAPTRRDEPALLEPAFQALRRPMVRIEAPGTLDGGDVLQVGKHVIVGLSARTNAEGADQLRQHLSPHGYRIDSIDVADSLHFKSDANWVAEGTLLVTAELAACPALSEYDLIIVDEGERYAANCVRVNQHLLIPEGYPDTAAKLSGLDAQLVALDVSECRKMDGGLTCLSLRF